MKAIVTVALLWSIVPVAVAQTGPVAAPGEPTRGNRHRAPQEAGSILVSRCVSCHGPEKKKGGLDLSRRASALAGGDSGAAIVPGRPTESLLIDKVAEGEMPP